MNLQRLLGGVADVRADEVRPVLLMFAYSVLMGVGSVAYEAAAGGLFLSQESEETAERLPYVYLFAALVTTAAGAVYTRLEAVLPLRTLLTAVLGCLTAAMVVVRIALADADLAPRAIPVIRTFQEVLWMLAELVFWTLAVHRFNLQQGKRLFALIGSGEMIAKFFAGAALKRVLEVVSVENLFLVSAAAELACLVLVAMISADIPHAAGRGGDEDGEGASGSRLSWGEVFTTPYLALIMALTAVTMTAWYLLDIAFQSGVSREFANPEDVATFLGSMTSLVGVLTLAARAFLAQKLITRLGVRGSLLVQPVAMAVTAAAVIASGLATGSGSVFWPLVMLKVAEEVLTAAVQEPSQRILFQPLPASQRSAAQGYAEGLVHPLTGVAVSLLLIGWTQAGEFTTMQAAWVLMGVLAGWGVLTLSLGRRYTEVLEKSLARRSLDLHALNLNDGSSRTVVNRYLASSDQMEVIYALNLMTGEPDDAMVKMLSALLNHPSEHVRLEALRRIERHRAAGARGPVDRLISEDPSPAVAGAAARTLVALGETDVLDRVTPLLYDLRPDVRTGAMVGLLRDGGIEGVLAAGEWMVLLTRSDVAADRINAAEILGQVGIRSFYRPLRPLLADPDVEVRRAAIVAAGQVGNPALWPEVLGNMGTPALRPAIGSALVAGGASALPALEAALERETGPAAQAMLLRCVRRIGTGAAIPILWKRVDHPEKAARREALVGLRQLNFEPSTADRATLTGHIDRDSGRAAWLLAALEDLEAAEASGPLVRALEIEIRRIVDLMFLSLGLLYPSAAIRDARIHLDGDSPEKRALAVEVVDQLVGRDLKERIFPLVEDLPRRARLDRLAGLHPQAPLGPRERLRQVLEAADWLSPWTRACAVFVIGGARNSELRATVARLTESKDRLLAETAAWTAARLDAQE
jgi:HEAT repeat protein